MTWNIIQNSTTMNPTKYNENFYHCFQGSITPKGSTTMENVADTYDIGSSVTTWKTLYANSISVASTTTLLNSTYSYIFISSVEVTAATQRIEFSGLNGDVDKEYFAFMQVYLTGGGDFTYMCFNNQTTSGYYAVQLSAAISAPAILFQPSSRGIQIAESGRGNDLLKINIYSETGKQRGVLANNAVGGSVASILLSGRVNGSWTDTSSTITSITFFTSVGAGGRSFVSGTYIELYKRTP